MAATELSVYGPAPTSGDGVLAAFVQQPVANTPAELGKYQIVYTEKWKGPYETGKEILSHVKIGDNLTSFHEFLGDNKVSRYDTPVAPVREKLSSYWQIRAIRVDEHTAGAHCFITGDCDADFGLSAGLTERTEANTWSVTWQSYSVTPYEFASGVVHPPIVITGDQVVPINWDYKASRSTINQYLSHNPETKSDNYTWTPNPKQPQIKYALCGAEIELMKKINQNRNATYHYPIVTHQTQFYGNTGSVFSNNIGSDLDVVTKLPSDCPYTFSPIMSSTSADSWTWIKIGDDMQQTRTETTVTFTRTERWAGYTDVDQNYYGTGTFKHDANGIKTGRWYKNCL